MNNPTPNSSAGEIIKEAFGKLQLDDAVYDAWCIDGYKEASNIILEAAARIAALSQPSGSPSAEARLREAITLCLDYAGGRETEWGERAETAFSFLHKALENTAATPPPVPVQTEECPCCEGILGVDNGHYCYCDCPKGLAAQAPATPKTAKESEDRRIDEFDKAVAASLKVSAPETVDRAAIQEVFDQEKRLDALFFEAFPTNHPATLDWISIKFELKKRRRAATPPNAIRDSGAVEALEAALSFINNMRVPQNTAEAGFQVLQGGVVIKVVEKALAKLRAALAAQPKEEV